MRAWIISPNGISDVGGVERVMLYADRALRSAGYEVRLLDKRMLNRSALGALLLPLCRGLFGPLIESAAYSLLLAAYKRKGDLVIGNGFSAFLTRADLLFCHGSMRGFRFAVKEKRSAGWRPAELMEAIAGKRARRLIAVSRRASLEWVGMYGVKKGKIYVIPNTVDAAFFSPREEDGRNAERPLRVLFIGRMGFGKGTDRLHKLIEATRDVAIQYVLAAPEASDTADFLKYPSVRLHIGVALRALPDLFRSCDVMYLPSRYEGFEMVTLEALASGLPVVGCKVGGVAELLKEGFPAVYRAFPDDTAGVAATLQRAAREWASYDKKRELNALTASRYGIARWTERFMGLVQHVR